MVSISGGRSPHQVWGLPGEPQSLPTSQVHNWWEGWVGILWSHLPLEISSFSPTLLCPYLHFHTSPTPLAFILAFFLFLQPVSDHGRCCLSLTGSPCGSLVWSLGSSKSILPIWVLLCRDQQVTLPWAHTVSQPRHFFNGRGKFPMSSLLLTDRL